MRGRARPKWEAKVGGHERPNLEGHVRGHVKGHVRGHVRSHVRGPNEKPCEADLGGRARPK